MSYIERRIVSVLVADLLTCGYSIDVNSRDDTELPKSRDAAAIVKMIFDGDIDESDWTLDLYQHDEGTPSSWVLLVLGNGSSVISDYTVNLDDGGAMKRALAMFDKIDGREDAWMAQELVARDDLLSAIRCAVAQLEADHDPKIAAEMFAGVPDIKKAVNINRHDVAEMCRVAIDKAEG